MAGRLGRFGNYSISLGEITADGSPKGSEGRFAGCVRLFRFAECQAQAHLVKLVVLRVPQVAQMLFTQLNLNLNELQLADQTGIDPTAGAIAGQALCLSEYGLHVSRGMIER